MDGWMDVSEQESLEQDSDLSWFWCFVVYYFFMYFFSILVFGGEGHEEEVGQPVRTQPIASQYAQQSPPKDKAVRRLLLLQETYCATCFSTVLSPTHLIFD